MSENLQTGSSIAARDIQERDLIWKPFYFLAVRGGNDRKMLFKDLRYDTLVEVYPQLGRRHSRAVFGAEVIPTSLKLAAKTLSAYGSELLQTSMTAMPHENASKQTAKIIYCLVRSKHHRLTGIDRYSYISSLADALLATEHPATELLSWLTEKHWVPERISPNDRHESRDELLNLRKFITACQGSLAKARQVISGNESWIAP
jgi:hypothetical protein